MSTVKITPLSLGLLLLLLLLLSVRVMENWAAAKPDSAADSQSLITSEMLNAKIKEIEKATHLGEGTKNKLLEFYRKSLDNLATAASQDALAGKFIQAIETAPAEIKKIREEMDRKGQPPKDKESGIAAEVPLEDIEQHLLKTKSLLTEIDAKVVALTRQLAAQNERRESAGQRLGEIKKNEEELLTALKMAPPPDEIPQVTEAQRWMQQTRLWALANETKMLNQEMVSMPVLMELAYAQREEAVHSWEETRSLMLLLEAKANRKHQDEAAKSVGQAEEAVRQVADSLPLLQQTAAANAALSDELQSITSRQDRIAAEKDALDHELKKLEENFSNTKQKIKLAGLSQALGLLMHEQRRSLPDERLLRKKAAHNEAAMAETGLLQVQKGEARRRLDDIDGYIGELISGLPPDGLNNIKMKLRELLISQREILEKIITANQASLGLLAELEALYRQAIATVTDFDVFLAERLLWIRSMPAIRLKDFQSLPQEAATLFAPGQWLATGKQLVPRAVSSPIFILACMLTAALVWSKDRMLARLKAAVNQAGNPTTYRFSLPLQAIGLTLLLALPGPLLLLAFAWQMRTLGETTEISRVVAGGLVLFSCRFFILRSFRILLVPQGLAAGFFQWPKTTLHLLRREAGFLIVSFLPAVFITHLAFFVNIQAGSSHTLGRLAFIAALCIIGIFFYRTLHPKTGVWHHFIEEHAQRFLTRLYPLFFFLTLLIPLILIVLVIAGYVFAVGVLTRCLINSIWLTFALVVCHQLTERWLIQSSRRLALQNAQNLQPQPGHLSSEKDIDPKAEPAEDLIELSAESRELLNTLAAMVTCLGLWIVWADVLPALKIFNEFTLWTYSAVVNGQTNTVPVTLADAGLGIFIAIITLTLTRHFPSLLKIVLLQHLNISPGARYTTTTLSRYLIGGTGLVSIANILGFSWSQIQWLVAALGVGIGFGLQEIVANFISGIIILFERPIRVGDVITIGTTDGVVTRIRIRATTIRDYDRKELLVPNKEFISGRLLNWSLSDPVIRILVPVGIAYGSEVQTAMTLMIQAAEENIHVLGDPKPLVTFDSFGDNSLLLTLRCFIGSVDDRVTAKSVLHQIIEQKFTEAGISMAFPQRDVHLDTNKPLDIRLVQEKVVGRDTTGPSSEEGRCCHPAVATSS